MEKIVALSLTCLLAAMQIHCVRAEPAPLPTKQPVVLLHGLARSADSMAKMARELESSGYRVCNVSYPTRKHPIDALASDFVVPAVRKCVLDLRQPVHFVTHSLGGIVIRQIAASDTEIKVGRVVMLSPPNQGSEVVDKIGATYMFRMVNGPAGSQLGTGGSSFPRALGRPAFELGVITGNRSVNPILSMLIPGADDGKVSLESAQLDGMRDFVIVPSSHPFIMTNDQAIEQTIRFLKHGSFLHISGDPLKTGGRQGPRS